MINNLEMYSLNTLARKFDLYLLRNSPRKLLFPNVSLNTAHFLLPAAFLSLSKKVLYLLLKFEYGFIWKNNLTISKSKKKVVSTESKANTDL